MSASQEHFNDHSNHKERRLKIKPLCMVAITLLVFFLLSIVALYFAVRITFPIKHLDIVKTYSGELETSFVLAVIMAESGFDSNAQSHAGAQGLMQLMPPTALDIAGRLGKTEFNSEDVWIPETNIRLGTFYLNWLYARYDGNLDLVLAAYNAGLGRVDSWLASPEFSENGQTLDVIPFPETHNYLIRVRQFERVYRFLLAMPF